MKVVALSLVCVFVFAAAASAQPTISTGGVANAASFASAGLPNGGVAQGSLFAVFGTNLGTASDPSQLAFPLQSQLGGTSIRVTSGSTTKDALMISVTPTQVAAILPSDTPTGSATLTVTVNGQTSAPQAFNVVPAAFGIFTRNQAGSGPAIIQNFVTSTDQPMNALTTVANTGQLVTLWGTGLGPATGNEAAGPVPGKTNLPVEVIVGGKPATNIVYAGRSGCCAAVDQITFQVPDGVQGCYVPVFVRVNGIPSNFASMSLAPGGSVCSDPGGFSAADLQMLSQGGRTGLVVLSRLTIEVVVPSVGSVETKTDTGTGLFAQYTAPQFLSSQGQGLPSTGSCAVYAFRANDILPRDPVTGTQLDAGPALNITGPNGAKQVGKTTNAKGSYSATLSGGGIGAQPAGYLDPGTYSINNGTGGPDVGAFTAGITIPAAATWTNRSQIAAAPIPRTQPLTLTWTGGDPNGVVEIAGASAFAASALSPAGGATFICTAPASAGQFTVPANILGALPASTITTGTAGASGFLLLGASAQPARFTATGLDLGQILAVTLSGTTVSYR